MAADPGQLDGNFSSGFEGAATIVAAPTVVLSVLTKLLIQFCDYG